MVEGAHAYVRIAVFAAARASLAAVPSGYYRWSCSGTLFGAASAINPRLRAVGSIGTTDHLQSSFLPRARVGVYKSVQPAHWHGAARGLRARLRAHHRVRHGPLQRARRDPVPENARQREVLNPGRSQIT